MIRLPQDLQVLSPAQRQAMRDLLALMGYEPSDYARPGSTERPGAAVGRLIDSGALSIEAAQRLRDQVPLLVGEHDRVSSIVAVDAETADVTIRKTIDVTYTIARGHNAGGDYTEIDEGDM